jgi:hypothetical protein
MPRLLSTPKLYALPGVALCLLIGFAAAAPPATKKAAPRVDYEREVKPLLTAKCGACHANGTRLGDLEVGTRAALLKGGQSGPAIVPGNSEKSLMIQLVSGAQPARIMPAKGPRLTAKEIATLKAWINQGASFGNATPEAAPWRPQLAPRKVALPAAAPGSGLTNPIDLLLQPYFKAHPLPAAKRTVLVDDRTYARRVYLDIIGLLPPPADLEAFVADKAPDKRVKLAQRLLAQDDRYAEHYLTFWNDMLRNDYAGTGYIDGGRTQITEWLYNALRTNMPYDKFVAQLVNPSPESAGFAKGIVWRGTVNASQTPQMQAAQNISQVFMGVNLKCASCHNSFVSTWKLDDAYGMASIYSEKALEMVRCDRPTGQTANIKFLYPELGKIDGSAPRAQRMEQLATVLTSRANGRLSRTLVNRLWARLMGHGLVEPTDEMDNRPWSPDLLDWLASDFAVNGYDVKKTIERIVTSRAYQMPAMALKSEQAENFVFAGPAVKRMSAEQYADAISTLTGVWPTPATGNIRISKGAVMLPAARAGKATTLFQTDVMRSGTAAVDVDVTGAEFLSLIATDGGDNANVDWADWGNPVLIDAQGKETLLTALSWYSATTGYGKIQIDKSIVEKPLRLGDKTFAHGIGTHANSVITYLLPPGTTRFRATAGPDTGATEEPKTVTSIRFFVVAGDRSVLEGRAALAQADPLTRALGRPNREQVVTQRSPVATTLQALELTNGQTLSNLFTRGAEHWTTGERAPQNPAVLVNAVYAQALGRQPTATERKEAVALVGSPVSKEGVEDLLWAMTMLPEFQLVY